MKGKEKSYLVNCWSNTSLGPLSFTFVSDRSFKFLRFQIGPLSFEFVSDRFFLSTSVKPKLICPLSETRNLKDLSETLET